MSPFPQPLSPTLSWDLPELTAVTPRRAREQGMGEWELRVGGRGSRQLIPSESSSVLREGGLGSEQESRTGGFPAALGWEHALKFLTLQATPSPNIFSACPGGAG